jgi:16S rRNA G966 N2-methylase RsmD
MHPNDRGHFEYQYQSIRYNAERLTTMLDPTGIADLRAQLKKSITDCWFGLMMKQTPRFFKDQEGNIELDTISHGWTPEYYKIAEGWPMLSNRLKGKSILDPYAGPGTLTHLLVARGIPSEVLLSDISYEGGRPLNDKGHVYASKENSQMTQVLFDDLPSWYKPDFSPISQRLTADSRNMDHLKDNAVDYVVTDPPYGKNYSEGSLGLLLGSIPEFDRVSREGSILMVPVEWTRQIRDAGFNITLLTGDVSRGHSKLPVCYIHVHPLTGRGK